MCSSDLRYIPIGSSIYSGTELAVNVVPFDGLKLGLNLSMSANEWGEPDDSEGSQYLYSRDDVVAGVDFDDLITEDTNDDGVDDAGNGSWDAGEVALHEDFVGKFGNKIEVGMPDRKSTRLNSSHVVISYAVFCLKKKRFSCLPPFDDY